jgi:hypothetical protein
MLAAAGRPQLLRRTLESIAACEKPPSYRGTLVIENGPRCGIESIVRGFAREHAFQYLYSEEPNKCQALNRGLARTERGLIVFTDDDVRVAPDWLSAYAAAAERRVRGQFYGGPVHVDAEFGLPPQWLLRYYPAVATPWERPPRGGPTPLPGETFMGPNWAAFAEEIVSAGGFDPKLGPGNKLSVGDETDVQRRLARRGSVPIYVPAAMTWHYLHQHYLDPQWLLARTFRHGVAWGVEQTSGGKPWLAAIARLALKGVNAYATAAILQLAGGEQRRFRAKYLLARWRGRWNGLWLGRQWSETDGFIEPATATSRAA